MNNNYKRAFSGVRPSDELNERILAMTEKKRNVNVKRALVLAAAVILLVAVISVSVNAATNGELFSQIKVYFNSALCTPDKVTTYVNENGNTVEENVYILGEGSEIYVRTESGSDGDGEAPDNVFAFGVNIEATDTTEVEIEIPATP